MPKITAAQRREAPRLVPRGSHCPRPACAPRCRRLALALALGRHGGQGTRCARPVLGPEATAPGARRPARALRPPRVRLYRASSWADCGSRTTASRKRDRRTKALGCQAGAPRLPPPHPWGPCDREFRRKRGDVISCFSAEPSRSQTLWEERRVHLGPRRPEEQATSASAPIKRGNFPLVSRKPCAGSEHTSIFCKITSPCEELHTAWRCPKSLRTGVAWPGRKRVRRRFSLE